MTEREICERLEKLTHLSDDVMTNFDHSIDEKIQAKLMTGKFWANHPAWGFCGDVWFQDGQFHEAVYRYHTFQGVYSANTLRELMEKVNAIYGDG